MATLKAPELPKNIVYGPKTALEVEDPKFFENCQTGKQLF